YGSQSDFPCSRHFGVGNLSSGDQFIDGKTFFGRDKGLLLPAEKTLSLAQSLYEKKCTTYPRTGSRYISEDIFEEIPSLLENL
ncbi:DNA topoisomerase, partial [Porphyromonas gingivalis]|uniref:DNA topoisomerase n=1 Tax=Porphyromonas gingivalis TaxID=837 RepID=UPI00211BACAA